MPALLSQSNKFMASAALILSVLAILLVVAMRTTPCASAAAGSCSVGDTEIFSGDITVDGNITFKSETANEYTFVHTATSARTIGLPDADVVTGSLMAGISANSLGLLAVGTNNFVLTADSGETTGMKWASGSAFGATFLYKAVDGNAVNNSATFVSDADLTFSVTANKDYAVWGMLVFDSATTPDIKFRWLLPASGTYRGAIDGENVIISNEGFGDYWNGVATATGAGAGTLQALFFHIILNIEGTPGTAVIQMAQNTANSSDTIVRLGSWAAYKQLN